MTISNILKRIFYILLQSNSGNAGDSATAGTFTPGVRNNQGSGTGSGTGYGTPSGTGRETGKGTGSGTSRRTEAQPDVESVLDAESDDESNNRPPPPSPLPHSFLPTHPSMVSEPSERDSNNSQKKVLIDKGSRGFQSGKINEQKSGDKSDMGDDGVDDMGHEVLKEPTERHQERRIGGRTGDGIGMRIGTEAGAVTGAGTGSRAGSGRGITVTGGLDDDKHRMNKISSKQSLQSLKKQQKSRQEQEQIREKSFQAAVEMDFKVTPPLSGLATPGLNSSKVRTKG